MQEIKSNDVRNTILIGDARTRLAELASASIDTVITSPPYFALRDYGDAAQLGLEADVDGWVQQLRAVCREMARVLKPTGSLWLNVGDGFSDHFGQGAPKKCLLLGPQRLTLALAEDGWIIRNQVIWAKANPLPMSVTDRLSCTYEVMLLLVRQKHYFFDLDAIRVPSLSPRGHARKNSYRYLPEHARPPKRGVASNLGLNRMDDERRNTHPLGKNPGDVWHLATANYRGPHFAAFPIGLAERPLLATCPGKTCAACGTPWGRDRVDRTAANPTLGELRPRCTCNAGTTAGIVLDPFLGTGTVAVAAERHGRDWLGIELNPSYAELARQRLDADRARHGRPPRRYERNLSRYRAPILRSTWTPTMQWAVPYLLHCVPQRIQDNAASLSRGSLTLMPDASQTTGGRRTSTRSGSFAASMASNELQPCSAM